MRFTLSHAEFLKLLTKAQNVVSAKATTPILSNLLLEAKAGQIEITATDMTVGVRCRAEARVEVEGATTLPAKKLAQLVRELNTPHIEVSTNEHDVTEITAGSSKFKLHGMSKNDYPALPKLEEATSFTLPQKELKEMLFRTAFAVSREDNRYVLTGMFLHIQDGKATFVGTDGKCLSKNRIPVSLDASFNGEFIVPLKAVDEIAKSLKEEGNATLYLMKDKIAVEIDGMSLISKLLSGDYPDISRIIPEKSEKKLSIHREELMSLLRQISLFTNELNQAVRFSFQKGELKLSAMAMEIGEGQVSMPVNYQGDALDMAFNPSYFLDVLRHCSKETVDLSIIDPYNPVLIHEEEDSSSTPQEDHLCLIMPMRLD